MACGFVEGRLWRGCYSCGFCETFGSVSFTKHLWMTASVCSFYNIKSFICDTLRYKLRKIILLDVILYITCILELVLEIWLKVIKEFIKKGNKEIIPFDNIEFKKLKCHCRENSYRLFIGRRCWQRIHIWHGFFWRKKIINALLVHGRQL